MKNVIILLALCCIVSFAYGQGKVKFGKIGKEDLTMTVYPKDSSANAVVLMDKTIAKLSASGGVRLTYFKHIRIKVLKKAGFDVANIEIPYRDRLGQTVTSLKAHTINFVNGKAVKTAIPKKDIFIEKETKYRKIKKFTFPNVKEGSILEYKYQFNDERFYIVADHYFQRGIPVRWSEFSATLPSSFEYRYDFNDTKLPLAINSKTRASINFGGGASEPAFKYHFAMQDVPALKSEPYITTMRDYRAAIRMHLAKYASSSSLHQTFISTWGDLNYTYVKNYGEYYNKRSNYKLAYKANQALIDGDKSPKEKMIALYEYVTDAVKWDEYYTRRPYEKDLNKIVKKGEGSSAEINLLLVALLREAGIDANPVLISTRRHGRTMSLIPFSYQFNHAIVKAGVGGKIYFLDAINADRPYNLLSFADMNVEGWEVGDVRGAWTPLPILRAKVNIMPEWELASDGTVSGKMMILESGLSALGTRLELKEDEDKYINETYKAALDDIEVTELEFKNKEKKDKRLVVSFNMESSSMAEATDEFIYFTPVCMTDFKENPFNTETRTFPVDIGYKIDETYMLKLKTPVGYTLDELPKPTNVALPNKAGSYTFAISKNPDGRIGVTSRLKINKSVFSPEFYPYLREFFDIVAEKQQTQLVFKKNP